MYIYAESSKKFKFIVFLSFTQDMIAFAVNIAIQSTET